MPFPEANGVKKEEITIPEDENKIHRNGSSDKKNGNTLVEEVPSDSDDSENEEHRPQERNFKKEQKRHLSHIWKKAGQVPGLDIRVQR